jgi:hypothetical protein
VSKDEAVDAAREQLNHSVKYAERAHAEAMSTSEQRYLMDKAGVHAQWAVYLQLRAMTEELREFRKALE